MSVVNQILIKTIDKLIDKKLLNLYYDKTFPSVVYSVNENGTYKISREGHLYDVSCALGIDLKVSQSVWVTIPCGMKNFKDMYISGLRGKIK